MVVLSNSPDLPTDDIEAQVNRILASALFVHSKRQCRFLKYIVDQMIEGNTDRLKGYTIGIEVFDRDVSFDPNIDSIVRVEAGRLRSKLREYYHTDGKDDSLLIEIPKGKYSLIIRHRESNDEITVPSKPVSDVALNDENYPKSSIAVLPLRTLSDDIQQDYFSDGMTDAIILALAGEKSLKVISLTSVMRFKNTETPLKQIAKELNVSHIIEGTVLKEGNNIRITCQLINSETDFHVWGDKYEREIDGVIALQSEIAYAIAKQLVQEIDSKGDDLDKLQSINPEAYEAYLLGRRTRSEFTKDAFYKAADYFKKAISLQPDYAAAYSAMGSCYCGLGSHGFELESSDKIIPQGLEHAKHAMDLDNSLADPHTYTGIMKLKYEWDWQGAEACFKKALSISPNDARAHLQYSMYFESLGEHEQAIDQAQIALDVDPLSRETNMNLAWQFYQANMLSESRDRLDRLFQNEPGFWGAYWDLAHVYLAEEDYEKAIEAFKNADNAKGGYFIPLQGLGYAYAKSGNAKEAKNIIKKLNEIQKDTYVSPFYIGTIYLGLGEIDKTFDYLEAAFKIRSRSLAWIKVAKEYKHLHEDTRFQDLVKRIGIPS
jgi:TolB-like protein/Tfp pilus assembly protein PilF